MQRIILHLDMNSYFASVEQQANPSLRGKPVGVVATMTPHGCILASSKEAKALGIKTGCRADEARFIYPKIVLIEVDPPKYRSTTQKIFAILRRYSEEIEPYSIDEAFVNLTGYAHSFEEARRIGMRIKKDILREAGEWLNCSMGIAPTRWLAKFGSDTCPKGGSIVLDSATLPAHLYNRELTEAWGIANATANHLKALGIHTLAQLAQYSPYPLMRAMGIKGYELWANVNGIETSFGPLREHEKRPKSIGHSHVLRKRTHDFRFHRALTMRLTERTGRKLRALQMEARGIFAYMNTDEQGSRGGSIKIGSPIQKSEDIFSHAWKLMAYGNHKDMPTCIAVGVFNLEPVSRQISLWSQPSSARLAEALDQVNNRFGEETIIRGVLLGLDRYHAPDRIGFRKSVNVPLDDAADALHHGPPLTEISLEPLE